LGVHGAHGAGSSDAGQRRGVIAVGLGRTNGDALRGLVDDAGGVLILLGSFERGVDGEALNQLLDLSISLDDGRGLCDQASNTTLTGVVDKADAAFCGCLCLPDAL